jgi:hypothetical protein
MFSEIPFLKKAAFFVIRAENSRVIMLMKLTPGVHFTNILLAAFVPRSFR